jgi:DNA polymerase-3 subunit beta
VRFSISRAALIKPLQLVSGMVERKHQQPILSNILIGVKSNLLSLIGTDLEMELVARVGEVSATQNGEFTVNAKKLVDICRVLPEDAVIDVELEETKAIIRCQKTKFTLATLSAYDFPRLQEAVGSLEFSLPQSALTTLLENTTFAMASQDVRLYMNGVYFIFDEVGIRAVATDGHRLMTCLIPVKTGLTQSFAVIMPRKSVVELQRLFADEKTELGVVVSSNHMRFINHTYSLTTKLIDSKFPDYRLVLPSMASAQSFTIDRVKFSETLQRVAALLSDKVKGARFVIQNQLLQITAMNTDRDIAEEELAIDYEGNKTEIGFNVGYLQEYLAIIQSPLVKVSFTDADNSALLEPCMDNQDVNQDSKQDNRYVIMPMKL